MTLSQALFEKAQYYIPGGVNSPVRAFHGVGGTPLFFKSAHGAYLIDEDDRAYIDYIGSWGPMIAGHAHPHVIAAVLDCIPQGLSFGAPTVAEIHLAEKICRLMPAVEQIRMVNSGTEATMSAVRLARGYTKRNKIIKFSGGYHGHSDSLLVQAGSGALTLGVPNSAGVPKSTVQHTLVAEFNCLETVEKIFVQYPNEIAAVLVEPVTGNMNCVLPRPGFLEGLRQLCTQHGTLLIFDEVMTGFRVALGGAQALYNISPDLTTLGKIIGGGLPVGAFGGRAAIMQYIAPVGPVYQAGTLSGNPITMAAGLATLDLVEAPGFYEKLHHQSQCLMAGLKKEAILAGVPFQTAFIGGMFGFFFSEGPVETYKDIIENSNSEKFKNFFHGMLEQGIYFAPSAYEAGFMSSAHGEQEIEITLAAAKKVFSRLNNSAK